MQPLHEQDISFSTTSMSYYNLPQAQADQQPQQVAEVVIMWNSSTKFTQTDLSAGRDDVVAVIPSADQLPKQPKLAPSADSSR